MTGDVTIVVPTLGRPTLAALLLDLDLTVATWPGASPAAVVLVDDRRGDRSSLELPPTRLRPVVLRSGGRGPAAARNTGWRAATTTWVSFLDDDVRVGPGWWRDLLTDLGDAGHADGSQGRVVVPRPTGRRRTDWERCTAALEGAEWITADMAYRCSTLARHGGFDERFRHAYREDSDLALRVLAAGGALRRGRRSIEHPVRPADFWVSVRTQRGNADDVLMRRRHGPLWRRRSGSMRGRLPRHVLITAATVTAATSTALSHRRAAATAAAFALAGWAELAYARVAPGPRRPDELARMGVTSAALPFAATWWHLVGRVRYRNVRRWDAARDVDPGPVPR